jgi:hypothetical protein
MLKVYLSKIILLLLLITVSSEAFSRKFYFSSTSGNDSYSVSQAQNSSTPWKTLVNLHRFANGNSPFGAAPNRAAAGDTFLFKCGDVFATGFGNSNDNFGVVKWWNGVAGYTAPSGTATAPIVFTSYGIGSKPNLLFPYPSAVIPKNKFVLNFKNVGYLYFDNLQFNDIRFPINDKVTSAYTSSGMMMGESNASICNNIKVNNCNFSNTCYGIISCARVMEITNNTFTNFKSSGDTIGINDIGADALQPSGYKYLIKNNLIQGSWAYANPNSSSQGKLGGGLETINDFDSSLIIYNTFIDNSGAMEFGQNNGTQYGPNDDTFAYNKFINNSCISYVNVTGTFACTAARLHFWNNVIVENRNSRHTGSNFGKDVLGDGQSFTNWSFWPSYPLNPTINNPGGWRPFQYSTDAGVAADNLYDIRNNIIWNNNGLVMKYSTRTKIKYSNNIYRLSGGSSLGATLGPGEILTTNQLFQDTTSSNPMDWDFNLLPNSPAINAGMDLGLDYDYNGVAISGVPEAGIMEYAQSTPPNPPPVNILIGSATQGSIACNGGTTTITVSATGGTAPYTGTGTFTVSAGTYNYSITDAAGNRDTVSVVVNQPSIITVNVASGTITTVGGTTSIQINATGGTGTAYQYRLNSGSYQSSNIFSGVPAGNHVVNVKDNNGCIVVKSFSISGPVTTSLIATSNSGTILCNGGTTTVVVSASGGVAPYTGTGSFTVTAGSRTYTITDAAGNTATTSINISQPSLINATVNAGTITVFGGSTTITVIANGGTGALTYKLDNGTYQASNIFNNVLAGTHTVIVKDVNSCTKSSSVTITQPASVPLNATAISGSILCNGSSTSVTVSATGGTTPYTGTGTFNVVAGTYAYTVTDANGNSSVANIVVTQPSLIIVNPVYGNITSSGGTTNVTVNATGGVSPFNYKLNNGTYQNSNIFSSVAAGTHLISVRDVNGCTSTKTIVIAQPSALNISATTGSISCNGGTTNVTISATGGTSPYTGTGNFIVTAGTYNYTVTDANGNSQSTSVTIAQPTLINATVTSGTISVYGGSTNVNVSANGGTAPYSYSLDNGTAQTSNIFNNVVAGNHTVEITDAKGCSITKNITITQPSNNPILVSVVAGQINCFGGTTMVTVSATGGTAPYTGTGAFSAGAGTRTYTVRDAAGATQSASITINQPTDIVLIVSVATDISVIGGTTSVVANATGGAGTYRYSLDAGPSQTSSTFRSVGAGTHFITVVDINGCSKMKSFTVNQVSSTGMALTLISKTDVTCKGGRDGNIEVKASGGRQPYQYAIGGGNYQINNRFYGLKPGTYRVFAKDANNNIVNIVVVILDGKRPCRYGKPTVIINAYPNPSTTFFKLSVESDSDEELSIEVIDLYGRRLYQTKATTERNFNFGQDFKSGSYFVRVTQGQTQSTQKIIKL